jgi:hypothetical protein
VVASDLPGVRVPVSKTGAGLVTPSADEAALARAVIAVLDAPEQYHGQTEALLRQSTPEAVAEAYEEIFAGLLARSQPLKVGGTERRPDL